MQWRVAVDAQNQNGSNSDSLTHYGVLGMRWGVRKDDERSAQKVANRVNSDQITSETIVKRRSDGSISVKNLREIASAEFDNQETYKKWLDNKTNPYAEEDDGYTYFGGERIGDGKTSIHGIGYTLNFSNEADYKEYASNRAKALENNLRHEYLKKYSKDVDAINKAYNSLTSFDDYGKVEEMINNFEKKIAVEDYNNQINGQREYDIYYAKTVLEAEGYPEGMIKDAIKQIEDEYDAMLLDNNKVEIINPKDDTDKAIDNVGKKTLNQSSKEVSSGKNAVQNVLSSIGSAVAKTVNKAVTAIGNAVNTAASFIKNLFKKK